MLTRFPQLKSLDLSLSWVKDTGLPKLSRLESLEEVAIDQFTATAVGFEELASVERLKLGHLEDLSDCAGNSIGSHLKAWADSLQASI